MDKIEIVIYKDEWEEATEEQRKHIMEVMEEKYGFSVDIEEV